MTFFTKVELIGVYKNYDDLQAKQRMRLKVDERLRVGNFIEMHCPVLGRNIYVVTSYPEGGQCFLLVNIKTGSLWDDRPLVIGPDDDLLGTLDYYFNRGLYDDEGYTKQNDDEILYRHYGNRITLAIKKPNDPTSEAIDDNVCIEFGYSICSLKDQFSRAKGREIAGKRLLETPFVIRVHPRDDKERKFLKAFEEIVKLVEHNALRLNSPLRKSLQVAFDATKILFNSPQKKALYSIIESANFYADFSDPSTFKAWQDKEMTIPATRVGDPIAVVTDQRGNKFFGKNMVVGNGFIESDFVD